MLLLIVLTFISFIILLRVVQAINMPYRELDYIYAFLFSAIFVVMVKIIDVYYATSWWQQIIILFVSLIIASSVGHSIRNYLMVRHHSKNK